MQKTVSFITLLSLTVVSFQAIAQQTPEAQPNPPPAAEATPAPQPAPAPVIAPPQVVLVPATTQYAQPAPAPQPAPPPEAAPDIFDPRVARQMPRKLRPIHGQLPPPGYVEIMQIRKGLVTAGTVLFSVSYGTALLAAGSSPEANYLAIPLIGPMIWGFRMSDEKDNEDDGYYNTYEGYGYYGVLWSMIEIAGLTMLIVGVVAKKKAWMRWDVAGLDVTVQPVMTAQTGGLALYGSF